MRPLRGLFAALALSLALAGGPAHGAAAPAELRVGLGTGLPGLLVSTATPGRILDAAGREVGAIAPQAGWLARPAGAHVRLVGPDGRALSAAAPVRIVALAEGGVPLVFAGSRWYRGELALASRRAGLTAINRVELEGYCYGVVPAEMPADWAPEALKAQAVAARSYALASRAKHAHDGFDLCATQDCQVYGGASRETAASNAAVDATRGEVVTYAGRVIPAYFHSAAGGYTENVEDVWARSLPYLRAVPDFDQAGPQFSWTKAVALGELAGALARKGVSVGEIVAITPLTRTYAGRVKTLEVVGSGGRRVVSGEVLRAAAGLKSTLFNVGKVGGEWVFAGRGFGHGLGMSQWGAKGLADQGYAYTQILAHYYPNTELKQLN